MTTQKFELGQVVYTQGIDYDLFGERGNGGANLFSFILNALSRHKCGDWGDLGGEDKALNEWALEKANDRLFSSYNLPADLAAATGEEKIWIITEWDRSATTVLYPSEY